jgi:hypothetical protein
MRVRHKHRPISDQSKQTVLKSDMPRGIQKAATTHVVSGLNGDKKQNW